MMQHFPMNLTPVEKKPAHRAPVQPWQYVLMEYARVGLQPPMTIPEFATREDAEIWMCLDIRYNRRLKELSVGSRRYPAAV